MPEEAPKPDSSRKALLAICVLAALSIAVFAMKGGGKPPEKETPPAPAAAAKLEAPAAAPTAIKAEAPAKVPRLLDLGAGKCIPCKAMAPILEDLKKAYEGKFSVEFIDVWERKEEAQAYGINMIPTQIFFDASGKELFRHEGFFSKEDILAKWKELGFAFPSP